MNQEKNLNLKSSQKIKTTEKEIKEFREWQKTRQKQPQTNEKEEDKSLEIEPLPPLDEPKFEPKEVFRCPDCNAEIKPNQEECECGVELEWQND